MGVGLFIGLWLARYLGPEQFGLFSFASAFTAIFAAVSTFGLQNIVVREIVQYPVEENKILGTSAILLILGGLIAYIAINSTFYLIRPEDILSRLLVAVLGATTLCQVGEVAVYWFESQTKSKYTVLVQNSAFVLFAVIKAILIILNAPLIAFALSTLLEAIIASVMLLIVFGKYGKPLKSLIPDFNKAKSLLQDSWPLMLSGIAVIIYMRIDQIMLGKMVDDTAVGIFSAAVKVSELWYFVPVAIVGSVFPEIIKKKSISKKKYYEMLQCLYDIMVIISVIIVLPMTYISTPLVVYLFGKAYEEAGSVLAIHLWSSVFVFLGVASSKWFVAENRQTLALQRTILGAITNIGLNFWLIPIYGVLGAAWATVISQAVTVLVADALHKDTRIMFKMKLDSFNIIRAFQRLNRVVSTWN